MKITRKQLKQIILSEADKKVSKFEMRTAERMSKKLRDIGYNIEEKSEFDQALRNTIESFQKMIGLNDKISDARFIGSPYHKATRRLLYRFKPGSVPDTGVRARRYFLHGPPAHRSRRFSLLSPEDKELVKISLERYGEDFDSWLKGEGIIDVFGVVKADVEKTGGFQYYPGLDDDYKILDPESLEDGREATVGKCSEKRCSAWVKQQLGKWQGNAWHAHRKPDVTAFKSLERQDDLAKTFSEINADPNPDSTPHKAAVSAYVKSVIPSQEQFTDLSLGDVVGLYYPPSSNHARAFYEGGTGYADMGQGGRGGSGPYFRTKEDDKPWSPEMTGQDIEFVPGNSMKRGRGFGMNTHLGFVGAVTSEGHPIVFHNVSGRVKARRVDAMKPDELAIVWSKTYSPPPKISENRQDRVALGVIKALLEAEMPDDAQDIQKDIEPAVAREIKHSIRVYNKVKKLNLPEQIEEAVVAILRIKEFFAQSIGVSSRQLGMLVNAAIGITGRESDFGQGAYYGATESIENLVSQWEDMLKSIIPTLDPSIGPAQMRFGKQFGEEGADLKQFGRMFDITNPRDLGDYTKALMAACALLANLYGEAQDKSYDTSKPGVARKPFTSTGNAALDISILAYNGGAKYIRYYCGEPGKVHDHKGCSPSSDNFSPNYIPALATKKARGTLSSLGYVSEVAKNMQKFKKVESLFR